MEQLIKQIEQWAEDRNIIEGTKPIDQAMKLFSEFGELADNVGKGRDCRDDIGDVFVVLTIMSRQYGININNAINNKLRPTFRGVKDVKIIVAYLSHFLYSITLSESYLDDALINCVGCLEGICSRLNYTLQECLEVAYNDIKYRKGVVYNGLFIKESDPAYKDALIKLGKAQ